MYDNGRAVPQNVCQAYTCLSVAIATGGQDQATAIPIRDMLTAKISPGQLARALQQVRCILSIASYASSLEGTVATFPLPLRIFVPLVVV